MARSNFPAGQYHVHVPIGATTLLFVVIGCRVNLFVLSRLQDYIDSMEGATKSALLCADRILEDTPALAKAAKEQPAVAA